MTDKATTTARFPLEDYELDGCDDPDCPECFDDAEPKTIPEYVPYVTWRFPK